MPVARAAEVVVEEVVFTVEEEEVTFTVVDEDEVVGIEEEEVVLAVEVEDEVVVDDDEDVVVAGLLSKFMPKSLFSSALGAARVEATRVRPAKICVTATMMDL